MSNRYRSDPEMLEPLEPTPCSNFLHYTWKAITCLFSHVTLVSMVVSYCILGAYTFSKLEVQHEIDVKQNISKIRNNVTDELWKLTTVKAAVLEEGNFTAEVIIRLHEFEMSLLKAINKDGWDGFEDTSRVQWTFTGALFYSIIVVTTIGYGHIAPKTTWGKVVTIFYAILGIPLMLLCLSNIGDVMATSFRFLYWRVCCYVCTRPKKPKRRNARGGTFKVQETKSTYRPRGSFRRSVRNSTRSADSGFGRSEVGHTSHSDTELRYHDEEFQRQEAPRGTSVPRMRTTPQQQVARVNDGSLRNKRNTYPRRNVHKGGSLDRRILQDVEASMDPTELANTPILCNKYVVDGEAFKNQVPGITNRSIETNQRSPVAQRRAISMPRTATYLEPPRDHSPINRSREDLNVVKAPMRRRRSRSPMPPKMMTPLGYGHRSKYLDDPDSDEEYYEDGYYESGRPRIKPVPIWLCVFLVVSYIIAGAFLFKSWEGWGFLDSAYFCFVTLTTIGFGDLVPAKGVKEQDDMYATISIALCSLYLLFGISLLAMSFNLVQEEVIANVKSVARTLGIIKSDDVDSESDEA